MITLDELGEMSREALDNQRLLIEAFGLPANSKGVRLTAEEEHTLQGTYFDHSLEWTEFERRWQYISALGSYGWVELPVHCKKDLGLSNSLHPFLRSAWL